MEQVPLHIQWHVPPRKLGICQHEIHIWRASLNQSDSTLFTLFQTLSPSEQEKANQFHFEENRRHFIAKRAILRDILGRYLAVKPECVEFEYGPYGKPDLRVSRENKLRLSTSCSHGMALYAIVCNRNVGVDLEYKRLVHEADRIVKHYFTSNEAIDYQFLPSERKLEAFFRAWTGKEAFLKAIGVGLTRSLDSVEISLDKPARLLAINGDSRKAALWSLYGFEPSKDYLASVVVEGRGWCLRYWEWNKKDERC